MDTSDGREKNARSAVATITAGVVVTGDVECTGDLQITGLVRGDVRCSTLFVDEGGEVAGGIYADRVRVSGHVDGTIEAGDLAIEPGARVSGTITYSRLKVSAGGIIEGSLQHQGGNAAAIVETGKVKPIEVAERVNPRRVYVD